MRMRIALALLLVSLASFVLPAGPACALDPTQLYYLGCFEGHDYYRYFGAMKWSDAAANARALGRAMNPTGAPDAPGYLVSITSPNEEGWLTAKVSGANWIGMSFGTDGFSWTPGWESGEPVNYQYWCPGEPNHRFWPPPDYQCGSEDVVGFSTCILSGAWNDFCHDNLWPSVIELEHCHKPTALIVEGSNAGISAATVPAIDAAALWLYSAGWEAILISKPTYSELCARLADPCVRGVFFIGHGVKRSGTPGIWLNEDDASWTSPAALGQLNGLLGGLKKPLDFFTVYACQNHASDWAPYFLVSSSHVTSGYFYNFDDNDMLIPEAWRIAFSGDGANVVPCLAPVVGPEHVLATASHAPSVDSTTCITLPVCTDGGPCSDTALVPTVCAAGVGPVVGGRYSIGHTSPPLLAVARIPVGYTDSLAFGVTEYADAPPALRAPSAQPIGSFAVAVAVGRTANVVPDSIELELPIDSTAVKGSGWPYASIVAIESYRGAFSARPTVVDSVARRVHTSCHSGAVVGLYEPVRPAAVGSAAPSVIGLEVWPSPGREWVRFRGTGLTGPDVTLRVVDAAGRIVWMTKLDARAEVQWNVRTLAGERVRPGVYFAVMSDRTGRSSQVRRTVLLR